MRSKLVRYITVGVVAIAATGAGIYTQLRPTNPIDFYMAPNGNDANPCTKAQPCASMTRIYPLATYGNDVEMAGGEYPPSASSISYTLAKTDLSRECNWAANNDNYAPVADFKDCITFKPASGDIADRVKLAGINLQVPYVMVDGGSAKNVRFDRNSSLANRAFDHCEVAYPFLPSLAVTRTGSLVNGSPVITGMSSTSGLVIGNRLRMTTGSTLQIPTGSVLVSVDSPTQVTISKNAIQTTTGTISFDHGEVYLTGTTTNGSAIVTGLSSTQYLAKGQVVVGNGIPAGAKILSVNSSTQITLDTNATATGSQALTHKIGCYYPGAGPDLGGSIGTTAYTCYGLNVGKPTMQGFETVLKNIWSNDPFTLRGSRNAIIGSVFDIGDAWRPSSGVAHMSGCRADGQTALGDYLLFDSSEIKNLLATHGANTCDAGGNPCPSGWMSFHYEGLHWEGGTNSTFSRNRVENVGGHNVFFQLQDGSTVAAHNLAENNIFGPICGDQPAPCAAQGAPAQGVFCGQSNSQFGDFVSRFNTIVSGNHWSYSRSGTCSWTGQLYTYGNLHTGAALDAGSFACTNQFTATPLTWLENHYGSGANPCGTNTSIGDPLLVSASTPIDPHTQESSPARDQVPDSTLLGCPVLDFYGTVRPQGAGAVCDAGAVQH